MTITLTRAGTIRVRRVRVFTDTLSDHTSVTVAQECIQAFNDLKMGSNKQWIIFKISDDWKEIVVEETADRKEDAAAEWKDVFYQKLINAKSKNKKGEEGIGGRYAVYDVEYDAEGGEGKRYAMSSQLM